MHYFVDQAAQSHKHLVHYSLYGGVEFASEQRPLAKNLLSLAVTPVTVMTLLLAMTLFHIPLVTSQPKPQSSAGLTPSNLVVTSAPASSGEFGQ